MRAIAIAGVIAAVLFGAWLRLHGLGAQIVQDDEWHAIHKLMAATYGEIARSFGHADHSIPLTLLYKAVAEAAGLDEVNMRLLQVACGIALVAFAPWLAWRVTRNAAVTALFAFLLAAAPFLVLYSRVARPYAICTLLAVLSLGAIWRWRTERSARLGLVVCALGALSAWLHPLSALFPAAAAGFVLFERPRAWRGALALALGLGASMLLPLALPLMHDWASLAVKAGRSVPDAYTLFRVAALFAGGLPDLVTALAIALAAFGAWTFYRAHRELGGYLLFVALTPVIVVAFLGGDWAHQGHTFARYVFPAQVIFLFWCAFGAVAIVRAIAPDNPASEVSSAAVLAVAYLAASPAFAQVRTLGPWYGHLYHHFDYVYEHNRAARWYEGWTIPDFYRRLGEQRPGTVPIIEAPFSFDAPWNPLAFYAERHRQPARMGFLHDLCYTGPRIGEVPRDPRFRFRQFVHLDDREAVLRSGAHYLVFHRESLHGEPFERAEACLAALRRLYGEPEAMDGRVAVFNLRAATTGKLQ